MTNVTEWTEQTKRERHERLEELLKRRGLEQKSTFENLLGAGVGLWDDDAEFEKFLQFIDQIRKE